MTDVSQWTSDDWQKLGTIDPDFEREWNKVPKEQRKLLASSGLQGAREAMKRRKEMVNATLGSPPDSVLEEESTVTARDGYAIPIKIYRPKNPPANGSPLVVWIHGGGFCIGGIYGEEANCRGLTEKHGATAVNIDYRLAPEHPFPTPVDDCWDVLQWAAANANSLGATPSTGFVVGGTSAGANLTGVLSLLARDNKLSPPLTGLGFLIPPFTDYREIPAEYASEIRSYKQNADAPVLGMREIELFMAHYNPVRDSKLYNILAPPADFANLPPAFFQVCGLDCLRDEAFVYERIMREKEGVKTKMYLYDGVPHAFYTWFPELEKSKRFFAETQEGVAWLLQMKK